MSTPDDKLERLAEDIADGRAVDWKSIGADAELTQSQIRGLQFIEQIRASSAEPTAPEGIEPGYEILEELGSGASASVFRAIDKTLKREVALKVIRSGDAPEQRRAQFLEEARVLASLEHPNIVRIYSIDEEAGRIRLSLERIDGLTLADFVEQSGPLSAQEAARVGIDLCRALAAIHEKGLVHLDLKPANVMRETGGRIVLLDFSVARSQQIENPQIVGTPGFMAPEQWEGQRSVSAPADLYALGVLLYWLACGQLPWNTRNGMEIRRQVLEGEQVPLLDRRPNLPSPFAQIVHRALARKPEERFRSAGAMAGALETFLDADRARRSRRRAFMAVGAIVLVGAAGLAISALWNGSGGAAPPSLAERPVDYRARLEVRRSDVLVPLEWGDTVRDGEQLVLALSTNEEAHVYVFNEDDLGNTSILFPLEGYDLSNPLPPGERYRLPGPEDGEQMAWRLGGEQPGTENFILVVSREPDPVAEQLLEELGEPKPFEGLSPETQARLRGVEGTTKLSTGGSLPSGPSTSLAKIAAQRQKEAGSSESSWTLIQLQRQ